MISYKTKVRHATTTSQLDMHITADFTYTAEMTHTTQYLTGDFTHTADTHTAEMAHTSNHTIPR